MFPGYVKTYYTIIELTPVVYHVSDIIAKYKGVDKDLHYVYWHAAWGIDILVHSMVRYVLSFRLLYASQAQDRVIYITLCQALDLWYTERSEERKNIARHINIIIYER